MKLEKCFYLWSPWGACIALLAVMIASSLACDVMKLAVSRICRLLLGLRQACCVSTSLRDITMWGTNAWQKPGDRINRGCVSGLMFRAASFKGLWKLLVCIYRSVGAAHEDIKELECERGVRQGYCQHEVKSRPATHRLCPESIGYDSFLDEGSCQRWPDRVSRLSSPGDWAISSHSHQPQIQWPPWGRSTYTVLQVFPSPSSIPNHLLGPDA